jgi:hypothetical protein
VLYHAPFPVSDRVSYFTSDENNWEVVDFRYPLSNRYARPLPFFIRCSTLIIHDPFHSCGQGLNGGVLYEEQVCKDEDEGFECKVDDEMEIYGVTHASWIGAPQPFYCG